MGKRTASIRDESQVLKTHYQTELAKLRQDLSRAYVDIAQANETTAVITDQMTVVRRERDKLQLEIQSLNTSIAAQDRRIATLQGDLDAATKLLEDDSRYQTEVAKREKIEAKLTATLQASAELRTRIEELDRELRAARLAESEANADLEQTKQVHTENRRVWKTVYEKQKTELEDAKATVAKQSQAIAQLQTQLQKERQGAPAIGRMAFEDIARAFTGGKLAATWPDHIDIRGPNWNVTVTETSVFLQRVAYSKNLAPAQPTPQSVPQPVPATPQQRTILEAVTAPTQAPRLNQPAPAWAATRVDGPAPVATQPSAPAPAPAPIVNKPKIILKSPFHGPKGGGGWLPDQPKPCAWCGTEYPQSLHNFPPGLGDRTKPSGHCKNCQPLRLALFRELVKQDPNWVYFSKVLDEVLKLHPDVVKKEPVLAYYVPIERRHGRHPLKTLRELAHIDQLPLPWVPFPKDRVFNG